MMNLEMMIAEGQAVFSNCYGVKAEKAKHRKSRKAKRLESRKHKHTGFNRNPDKDADRYGRILVQNREKTLFKENLHNVIADAEAEYAEYLATEKAEVEAKAERIRITLMSEEEKKTKRNLLKNALIKEGMGLDSLFTTERGIFFFDDLVEYAGDYFEPYTKTVGKALFKCVKGKSRYHAENVYILWQKGDVYEERDAISPRSADAMIEDMIKII